jgi:hypothetical protein
MVRNFKQIALSVVCLVTMLQVQLPAQAADSAADTVEQAWKARAEAATKRLASPGLDRCDRGLELAFQQPNQVTSGTQRSFELPIEIDRQAMVASYIYAGQRLTSFALLALPSGWLAVQKADSKTLNILVTSANCSFELCTSDPFAAGACAK